MELIVENSENTCSYKRFQALCQRNIITSKDINVMKCLLQFVYSTKITMSLHLKVNVEKSIKRLLNAGLIHRCYFRGEDTIYRRTAVFYKLSAGGYFIINQIQLKHGSFHSLFAIFHQNPAEMMNEIEIAERLVNNQFRVVFTHTYNNKIRHTYYDFIFNDKNGSSEVYADLFKLDDHKSELNLITIPLRKTQISLRKLHHKLDIINSYYTNKKTNETVIIIVIAEDDNHAQMIEQFLGDKGMLIKIPIYYTTDTLASSEPILSNLIEFHISERAVSFNYVELSLL